MKGIFGLILFVIVVSPGAKTPRTQVATPIQDCYREMTMAIAGKRAQECQKFFESESLGDSILEELMNTQSCSAKVEATYTLSHVRAKAGTISCDITFRIAFRDGDSAIGLETSARHTWRKVDGNWVICESKRITSESDASAAPVALPRIGS